MTLNTSSAPNRSGKALNRAIIICAIVALAGVALWIVQLSGGLVQTGMRNLDSWGTYILGFMWFVGLSAGGLIISSMPRVFGMKGFGGISKIAIMSSLACTICAVALILIDLGNPLRIWELFVYSNLSSPIMWDVLVITIYLVLSVIYLVLTLKNEAGKISDSACRIFSGFCLVIAVLVHTVTAWIIGLQNSHEFWNTALMGPWFVCSALASGTALVLLICIIMRKVGYLELDQAHIVNIAKMLGVFCLVDLYLFGCDLLTTGYAGTEEGSAIITMLISGQLAPFFWGQVVLCALSALCCFIPSLRSNGGLIVASLCAMTAILCKRIQLIIGGFQLANITDAFALTDATITTAQGTLTQAYAGLVYAPTPIELGIFVAVLALCAFIFLMGVKFIDLKPHEGSH